MAKALKINPLNPAVVYSMIWGFCILLYNLEFTTNIIGLNSATVSLVLGSIGTFILAYLIVYSLVISKNGFRLRVNYNFLSVNSGKGIVSRFSAIIQVISIVWAVCTVCEIIAFKGVPLISVVVFRNYEIDYAKFGLPTLHGLLNSLYLIIITSQFLLYSIYKKKRRLWLVSLLLLWPILVMSRALLLWTLIELLSVYFLFNTINIKRILFFLLSGLLVILLFGAIGDSRVEANTEERFTDTFIKDNYKEVGAELPSGFVWVYIYITTPLNNVVWGINKVVPDYNVKHTFAGLLPSVISSAISGPQEAESMNKDYPLELYEEAFNVSSYFANYLRDFGKAGALIFVFFVQLAVVFFYFSARSFKLGSILAYATLFNSVIMSIFFDYFFSLVTIFQVVIGIAINYFLYRKPKFHV